MGIDSDLTFKKHVMSICSKANQKLHHALTRVSKYKSLQALHSHEVVYHFTVELLSNSLDVL